VLGADRMRRYRWWLPQDVLNFVMWLYWWAEFTPRCGPERPMLLDQEKCSRHVSAVDRNVGDGEPFRLGLAQGRLQEEACAIEISSLTFGYLAAIGCREWGKEV